ncbi:PadR family transcriptional regulator [Rhodococcus xishaensis]|uniref:PadR family transcriptional regulator n=1 Tax=Rhodococcus xishaensis TaxID=2487364 RepID=A0A3S3E5E1_9NOCA|nr:PadR family transcriptional regulator [Rhodococcus xishaensis]RVW05735.1 PadR family transcriptional regulator [Rhodococcus xishaensis]
MIRLTPTSYVVLGLVESSGEATPYELKQQVAAGVGNFWSLQHAQVYGEPERLAGAGYLEEHREESGRRRKRYRLTDSGREALAAWREEKTSALSELRDLGLLKLYFGADPHTLAVAQLAAHREKLAEYERIAAAEPDPISFGPRMALEAGIGHEREWVEFWERVAEEAPKRA